MYVYEFMHVTKSEPFAGMAIHTYMYIIACTVQSAGPFY